jgi:hypothetical protein
MRPSTFLVPELPFGNGVREVPFRFPLDGKRGREKGSGVNTDKESPY